MPRTGRGGSRQGTPGQSYSNRTDLQANKLPVTVVPGQQYGQGVAQRDAQRVVPMGAPPSPGVASAPSPALGTAGGPSGPPQAPGPLPGQVIPLDAPTQRPNEPITAGMPLGTGPGPEALAVNRPGQDYQTGKDFLASQLRGAAPNSPEIAYLLAQMQARGL